MTVQSPDTDEINGKVDGGAGSMKAGCADAASGNHKVVTSAAQLLRLSSMKTDLRLKRNLFG